MNHFNATHLDLGTAGCPRLGRSGPTARSPANLLLEAIATCEALLVECAELLPSAFVVDIGWIEGRGWAVVEFNPVSCSGLLGCDPARVLDAVVRGSGRKAGLEAGDRRWVVPRGSR